MPGAVRSIFAICMVSGRGEVSVRVMKVTPTNGVSVMVAPRISGRQIQRVNAGKMRRPRAGRDMAAPPQECYYGFGVKASGRRVQMRAKGQTNKFSGSPALRAQDTSYPKRRPEAYDTGSDECSPDESVGRGILRLGASGRLRVRGKDCVPL